MDHVSNFVNQFGQTVPIRPQSRAQVKLQLQQKSSGMQAGGFRPKRALTPYLVFAQEKRNSLKHLKMTDQMKEIGKMWNQLTAIGKGVYEQKAKQDKDRFDEQMALLPPSAVGPAEQKRKCRRRLKPDNPVNLKPKKTLSPYILFVKEMRPKYTQDQSGAKKSFSEIMQLMGQMWRKLPVKQKAVYIQMSEEDRERHQKECLQHAKNEKERMTTAVVKLDETGMPKKPLSAYLSFARDVRDVLKRKQPNASVTDIMHAVSIDWVKLEKEQRRAYFQIARKNKWKYFDMMKEWEDKHGKKRDGDKQLLRLEERKKASIVSFLTHGLEFNKAAVFSDKPADPDAGAQLNLDDNKDKKEQNPEESNDENSQGDIGDEQNQKEMLEFLETKEYEKSQDNQQQEQDIENENNLMPEEGGEPGDEEPGDDEDL